MWFHIDPAAGVPIYMQLTDQVKRAAASGLLKPGDQLPSVRELAVELTVNPNTIAKAYQELEREGVITTVRGRGTFVAAKINRLLPEERLRVLQEAIDKVLVEAHHLQFAKDEVLKIFTDYTDKWFAPLAGNKGKERE